VQTLRQGSLREAMVQTLRQGEWYPQLAIIVKHSVRMPINKTYIRIPINNINKTYIVQTLVAPHDRELIMNISSPSFSSPPRPPSLASLEEEEESD